MELPASANLRVTSTQERVPYAMERWMANM